MYLNLCKLIKISKILCKTKHNHLRDGGGGEHQALCFVSFSISADVAIVSGDSYQSWLAGINKSECMILQQGANQPMQCIQCIL